MHKLPKLNNRCSKRKNFRLKPISCIILTTLATMSSANANPNIILSPTNIFSPNWLLNTNRWSPRFTLSAQEGSYGYAQPDIMFPFLGRDDSLFFIDTRVLLTTRTSQEYNLGLGHRRLICNNSYILGGYVWLDRLHSKYDNNFNQASIGGELLGNIYDFRANLYFPFGNTSQLINRSNTPFITGHTIGFVRVRNNEEALTGGDVEVGRVVPCVPRLHAFADYYHFGSDNDLHMNGGRARFEYHYNDNLIFTASYSYDNIRHSTSFIGFRYSFGGVNKQCNSIPLRNRMEDFVIRDPDIITVTQSDSRRFIDSQRFWFVNNAAPAGGDGTYEHPFNTEIDAENASRKGDGIYTFKGNGIYGLPDGGLDLKPNQLFIGSGSNLIFRNITIIPANSPPLLQGRINVANGDTLTGFSLTGERTNEHIGIAGNNVSNVSLSNLNIYGFSGLSADGTNSKSVINGGDGGAGGDAFGIQMENSTNINISNITVSDITGGSANGGDANATTAAIYNVALGGDGGTGGNATGIDLRNSSATLSSVTISNITAGSASGGDATARNGNNYNVAFSGDGGIGGKAAGVDLRNSSVTLSDLTVSNIEGGVAKGGRATATNYSQINRATGGDGLIGGGGSAIGIDLNNASSAILSNVTVSKISGGSAIGGDGNASGAVRNYANGGYGGDGGRATGIDLTNSFTTLSQVTVSKLSGGSAKGGDGIAIGVSDTNRNYAHGGFGGIGGDATGINLTSSSSNLKNVSVMTVTGGSGNGGDATTSFGDRNYSTGDDAQVGGNAKGLDLTSARTRLSNITISDITGGSADSGDASAVNGADINRAESYGGQDGGQATGIDLTNTLSANLSNINITHIQGGSAKGGDANASSLIEDADAIAIAGYGDSAGRATGIDLTDALNPTLSGINISNIYGGSANGGSATSSLRFGGGEALSRANNVTGTGGNANGIDLTNAVNSALSNIKVVNINGGSANGGSATTSSTNAVLEMDSYGGNAGIGGNAIGLNLSNTTQTSLSNILISNITGGSANGGDASLSGFATTYNSTGGNGGTGGDAIGIDETNANNISSSSISINAYTGGTANKGTGATSDGINGTPGTGIDIKH